MTSPIETKLGPQFFLDLRGGREEEVRKEGEKTADWVKVSFEEILENEDIPLQQKGDYFWQQISQRPIVLATGIVFLAINLPRTKEVPDSKGKISKDILLDFIKNKIPAFLRG